MTLAGVYITPASAVGYGSALVLMLAFAIAVVRSTAKRTSASDSASSAD